MATPRAAPKRIKQIVKIDETLIALDEDGLLWVARFFPIQMLQAQGQDLSIEWHKLLPPEEG